MNSNIKRFQQSFLLFLIADAFFTLGLFSYGSQIKALARYLDYFVFFIVFGSVFMIIASARLLRVNKHFFHFFLSSVFLIFAVILNDIGSESTNDFTVAWTRGLEVSTDILLCLCFVYFFLGTELYFKEQGLLDNSKRSKAGYIFIISATVAVNIISYLRTFDFIKVNHIASAALKYGSLALKLVTYVFILVVLIIMIVQMHKLRVKGVELHNEEAK